jgi:H+-translocating NAD(P) transhydrogenase subunit beta
MSQFLVDLCIILILLGGISQFRTPRGARFGNLAAALAILCALVVVLSRHHLTGVWLIVVFAAVGAVLGSLVAARVNMIGIPAMVAFQHGAGGVAAFLVSAVELTRMAGRPAPPVGVASALLGLIIGAATFSGSMVASGKLANRLRQTPIILPRHSGVLLAMSGVVVVSGVLAGLTDDRAVLPVLIVLAVASVALGIVFSIRIGGADMPVLISFLNATAGLAAALCGVAIGNRLLIACGATVAASGSILTHVMCRAMNRGLATVFAGIRPSAAEPAISSSPPAPASVSSSAVPAAAPEIEAASASPVVADDGFARAAALLKEARSVIIIPGYGMALADAQGEVVKLAEKLVEMGAGVYFAIHPVAGRMPGHMHVLLAEAEVDYGLIREMKDINPQFPQTDVALIVGACDVVNPAAIEAAATPISGMPILRAHEARHVVVCNLDARPGYSGVENPLYTNPKTITLFGDAKATVTRLLEQLQPSEAA